MKIIILGLFNWKNNLWDRVSLQKIAKEFLGSVELGEDGWYSITKGSSTPIAMPDNYKIDVKVSHSRIIINVEYLEQNFVSVKSFADAVHIRETVVDAVDKYLELKSSQVENLDFVKKKFPDGLLCKPFIFRYPLIILNEESGIYKNFFRKDREEAWKNIPWDISTTCFFTALPDTGRKWWKFGSDKKISMRVSGASLITRQISNMFEQSLINLIYHAGLYEMTRVKEIPTTSYVYKEGLEPLLEKQGSMIDTELRSRVMDERMEKLNRNMYILTIILLILTVPPVMIEIYKLFFEHGCKC